jgi:hypothetical protein
MTCDPFAIMLPILTSNSLFPVLRGEGRGEGSGALIQKNAQLAVTRLSPLSLTPPSHPFGVPAITGRGSHAHI